MGAILIELGHTFMEPDMMKLLLVFVAGIALATYVPSVPATLRSVL